MRLLILSIIMASITNPNGQKFALHIEQVKDSSVAATPYTAPMLYFTTISGVPQPKDILYCAQVDGTKTIGNQTVKVVMLKCDDGTILELKGIDLIY